MLHVEHLQVVQSVLVELAQADEHLVLLQGSHDVALSVGDLAVALDEGVGVYFHSD